MKHLFLTLIFIAGSLSVSAKPFLMQQGKAMTVDVDLKMAPIVQTAFEILQKDYKAVFGAELTKGSRKSDIKVEIDKRLTHPEEFCLSVNNQGVLTVSGSDAHGVAYGLLELSRMIGVSPWEWWADSKTEPLDELELIEGYQNNQYPSVRYRGIFINDEDWGLMPWSYQTMEPGNPKGVIGPKTSAKIFELLLRLRANTYWPPMHSCSKPYFLTDGNREVAKRYGIYIGTSHCEPMACNALGEWNVRGQGEYNYVTNADNVRKFWQERVDDVRGQEIIYTVGMRGIHDDPMNGVKEGSQEAKELLQQVINDQLKMAPKDAPKVFIPYKEVLDLYNKGIELPDDITLMWTDDNYGYIRHFPTDAERARKGGNGVYYHVSYWGRPHDYLWLGTFSPYLLYQQMSTAYDRGIQDMWILNVGDIKPAEYQIELFMDMGWDIQKVNHEGVERHMRQFYLREFGKSLSDNDVDMLVDDMNTYYRLAFMRRPEFMADTRTEERDKAYWATQRALDWSYAMPGVTNDGFSGERTKKYAGVVESVKRLSEKIDADHQDAYFQLVEYPVHAAACANWKYLIWELVDSAQAKTKSDHYFDLIKELTERYNSLQGGKWRGIMDMQPRKQPVFDKVNRPVPLKKAATAGKLPLPVILEAQESVRTWDGLGYSESVMELNKSQESFVRFVFKPEEAKKVTVYLAFIPTLPLEGDKLEVEVKTSDSDKPAVIQYATYGRSEEWKVNVLWNRSIKKVPLDIKTSKDTHYIEIRPLSEGVLLDDVYVIKEQ